MRRCGASRVAGPVHKQWAVRKTWEAAAPVARAGIKDHWHNTMPTPKIVHWEWKRTLPQFVAYMAILVLCYLFFPAMRMPHILILGSGIYLAYSMSSRWLIPHRHRRGIRLLRQEQYLEAISAFEESLEFFTRHSWIDTYRAITLMTPTTSSFREMALMNIAFAYGQLGDGGN